MKNEELAMDRNRLLDDHCSEHSFHRGIHDTRPPITSDSMIPMPEAKKITLINLMILLFSGVLSLITGFIWNSVIQTREGVVRLEATHIQMQKALDEMIPRTELELRFKSIESQMIEMRMRQQNTELELIKLKDHK